jgi:hypothetical protein
MLYKINNASIDSEKYHDQLKKRYYLPFMKEIIDLSGCTLKECRELIDKIILEEKIEIDPAFKAIQDYCFIELQENMN